MTKVKFLPKIECIKTSKQCESKNKRFVLSQFTDEHFLCLLGLIVVWTWLNLNIKRITNTCRIAMVRKNQLAPKVKTKYLKTGTQFSTCFNVILKCNIKTCCPILPFDVMRLYFECCS